jgi:hypothetical protein
LLLLVFAPKTGSCEKQPAHLKFSDYGCLLLTQDSAFLQEKPRLGSNFGFVSEGFLRSADGVN